MEETPFTISNKMTGIELKRLYSEKCNLPLKKYKIRLLYKGQEILDEHKLYFHNIDTNAKIHVNIADLL